MLDNTFKIIGGKHKGRKFDFPKIDGLRPTSSKIRETLFNWLQFETQGKTFLDLFAGSGALSFEAISRGAKQVVSVEKNTRAFNVLEKNKQILQAKGLTIIHQDAFLLLDKKSTFSYDCVFLDPPFNKDYLAKALKLIMQNDLLVNNGKIYIESEYKITPDFLMQNFNNTISIKKQKKSGAVHYCLIQL